MILSYASVNRVDLYPKKNIRLFKYACFLLKFFINLCKMYVILDNIFSLFIIKESDILAVDVRRYSIYIYIIKFY